MTVRELAEKLSHYKYQDAEVNFGCDSNGGGNCLYTDKYSDGKNILMCDYPENCEYYVKDAKHVDSGKIEEYLKGTGDVHLCGLESGAKAIAECGKMEDGVPLNKHEVHRYLIKLHHMMTGRETDKIVLATSEDEAIKHMEDDYTIDDDFVVDSVEIVDKDEVLY